MIDEIVKQVLPALRMMASRENVLIVRLDDRELFKDLEDETALRNFPFIQEDASILVVDETTDPAEIVSDLEVKLSMWREDRTWYPDYVWIKKVGLVALAPNAAQLDEMLGNSERDFSIYLGRLAEKIAIVTGAAMGFGAGIAEMLFQEGANVVIADWNEEAGGRMADALIYIGVPHGS